MALIDSAAGREVPIPHEPGDTMTFRRLNWTDLERARHEQQVRAFRNMGEIGPDLLKQLQGATSESVSEALADPLAEFDLHTVLCLGIVAWSYDAEVTTETVKQLDPETATWAALEILQPQTAEQRKNFSTASTGPSTATASPLTNGSSHASAPSSDARPAMPSDSPTP